MNRDFNDREQILGAHPTAEESMSQARFSKGQRDNGTQLFFAPC